ncbi:hypothetical protein V1506DRAFT_546932 [Lipomyces tetrasporus]
MITMNQAAAAARELRRCVKVLGFVGALVENHVDGQFYDDERFWPVFKTAQELDVPIYIHPCFPVENMVGYYKGNYGDSVAVALSAYGWSWHSETGPHILRIFASGLFDRFPGLKIVIGHYGRTSSVSARAHYHGVAEVGEDRAWSKRGVEQYLGHD